MGRYIATIAVLAIMGVIALSQIPVALAGDITPQMELVVTIDGKSFYAEYLPYRNWTDAAARCEALDMKLASVTSMDQFNALNVSHADHFDGSFWTSGRDAYALRQFSWNATDEQPLEEFRYRTLAMRYRTCLIYFSAFVDSYFFPYQCEGEAGTLCET